MANPSSTKKTKNLKEEPFGFIKDPLWYKDAIIYQLHVKSYFDSNDDGVGDFPGLIQKLPYIAALGVNTVWLLPFYPSPRKDDGYDIAEYTGVHPDYGSLADVKKFILEAHKLGLRVITELVINHTSDQHPWFQKARKAKPGSPAREFYVWSDTDEKYSQTRIIFTDSEKSNWSWDPEANAFYWHRFFSHQPDLNFDNPAVLQRIIKVMKFWLDIGVDGLRLDAIPYLIEREGTSNENLPETHEIIRKIRKVIDASYPDRMLLAEANMWPEDVQTYFGKNDECHMAFHFPLMPRIYLALAQEDRFPISDILRQTPDIDPQCQWVIFLRNHDELTLEMVSDTERAYMLNFYAAETKARLNVGIRRRLAPLVQRDRRRLELMTSLLLSMPGTPVIYYGDEIGMGDNIHLGDRDGVRTPMQWSPDRNGGFSRVDPSRLVLPLNMDSQYGYLSVNVESQAEDNHSLLNWTRKLLLLRKAYKSFGRGKLELLYPDNRKVLVYIRSLDTEDPVLCIVNLSGSAQAVELDIPQYDGYYPIELFGGSVFPRIGKSPYMVSMGAYDFYWFRLSQSEPLSRHQTESRIPELRTLVLFNDIRELESSSIKPILEQEVLPIYLSLQAWFSEEVDNLQRIALSIEAVIESEDFASLLFIKIETQGISGLGHAYFLPLGIHPQSEDIGLNAQRLLFSRIRKGPDIRLLIDILGTNGAINTALKLMADNTQVQGEDLLVNFHSDGLSQALLEQDLSIRRAPESHFNNTVIIGEELVLKVERTIEACDRPHPVLAFGEFLKYKRFDYVPKLLGDVTFLYPDGKRSSQIFLHAYIHNKGSAWTWYINRLEHLISDTQDALLASDPSHSLDPWSEIAEFSRLLGERLGNLHTILLEDFNNDEFGHYRANRQDINRWIQEALDATEIALVFLNDNVWQNPAQKSLADSLLKKTKKLPLIIKSLAQHAKGTLVSRVHGNFHLERVLVSADDIQLIGLGETDDTSVNNPYQKKCQLIDVASMLRSFAYVAFYLERKSEQTHHHREDLAGILARYVARSQEVFLESYFAHHQRHPKAGLSEALAFFTLTRSLHELTYESKTHPEWIESPLRHLNTILDKYS